MNATSDQVMERLLSLVGEQSFRTVLDAHALDARARLASDPTATMSWSALPARAMPDAMPSQIASAWVFVVRRGKSAGCHMHPNSTQRTIALEGTGTLLVGPPEETEAITLGGDQEAGDDTDRGCAIAPGTYHDAVAGSRDWVVVSFHTARANALAEVEYGAESGTSDGFVYDDAGSQGRIRIDPRCRPESTPFPRLPRPEEFGRLLTANMFRMSYEPQSGWGNREIVPVQNLSLHPATPVFHYGQTVFEGLKAFRIADGSVALFRADAHARRFQLSCRRLAMPAVPEEDFLDAIHTLVAMDQARIPADPEASLYLRPFAFGCDPGLGVHPARRYLFLVFACVVGKYSGIGGRALRITTTPDYVRAVRGGTGAAKTGANYAGSLVAQEAAVKQGFDQVLWLDALEQRYVEELGAMNFFVTYGERLVTPPLGGTILPGVTRDSILRLAPDLGLSVQERPLEISEVLSDIESGAITEVFAAGTAAVIAPVGEITHGTRRATVASDGAGPVARRLYESLHAIRGGHAPDPYGWLQRVAAAPASAAATRR